MEKTTDTLTENKFPDLPPADAPFTYDAISPLLPFRLLEPAMIPLRGKRKRHYGISALTAYTEEEEIDGIFLSDDQMHQHYLQLNHSTPIIESEAVELEVEIPPVMALPPIVNIPKTKKTRAHKKSVSRSKVLKSKENILSAPTPRPSAAANVILKTTEAALINPSLESLPITKLDSKAITRIARRKNKMEEQIHLSNPKAEEFLKKYVHEQEDKKHESMQHQQEVAEEEEEDITSTEMPATTIDDSAENEFAENDFFAPAPRPSQISNDHDVDEEKMTREEWLRFIGKDSQSHQF